MRIAIMQPYLFPYIGYFQMMHAVDEFVFLDDVNYINKGWINRNRILVNGKDYMLTVPLKEASQNKLINEIEIAQDGRWQAKNIKTLELSYKKAPYFDAVFPLLEKIILSDETNLGRFILKSFSVLNAYLGVKTPLTTSSSVGNDMRLKGQDRILDLCRGEKADEYINAIGGKELYSRELFSKNNVRLHFIKSHEVRYPQFQNEFIPWLSIIDVMMFNSAEQVRKFLNDYELI